MSRPTIKHAMRNSRMRREREQRLQLVKPPAPVSEIDSERFCADTVTAPVRPALGMFTAEWMEKKGLPVLEGYAV